MRKIIHIDMDAFFASVEQRDAPELKGKPVVVGGPPGSRGVVAACSYEARKFGVHSAMPSSQAVKLCADAIFIKPNFEAYREASQQIHKVLKLFTKLIEPLSLDEAYLDVTDYASRYGSATEVAQEIKQLIKNKTNLTASAGVSYNKFLAKIASDMDKPDGLYVIRPDSVQPFIDQLEIRKFFGVGKVTEKKMQSLGIYHGADLRAYSKVQLQTQFGRSGEYYYNVARGIDERPVSPSRVRKSVSKETTFNDNIVDKKIVWLKLQQITQGIEEVMESKEMVARTVTLKMRYPDFQQITRSKTTQKLIHSKEQMLDVLPELLKKTEVGKRPIRLIGVTLSNLQSKKQSSSNSEEGNKEEDSQQLGLFL